MAVITSNDLASKVAGYGAEGEWEFVRDTAQMVRGKECRDERQFAIRASGFYTECELVMLLQAVRDANRVRKAFDEADGFVPSFKAHDYQG